jgi:hypothetical protein
MLASTVQFSKNNQTSPHLCNSPPSARGAGGSSAKRTRSLKDTKSVFPQDPTAYRSVHPALSTPFHAPEGAVLTVETTERLASQHPLMSTTQHQVLAWVCVAAETFAQVNNEMLLRKEVIQPHLPVRLPCYDFVPIASPTFDRSPPCGLSHGLRVLPTFVT